jgi:hypothetical protein
MNSSISNFIISLIKAYRFILSPWLGMHCRFHPTCSVYAIEAIQQYGVLHGSYLAIKRLGRCHPWHEGGIDPVPDTEGQSGR